MGGHSEYLAVGRSGRSSLSPPLVLPPCPFFPQAAVLHVTFVFNCLLRSDPCPLFPFLVRSECCLVLLFINSAVPTRSTSALNRTLRTTRSPVPGRHDPIAPGKPVSDGLQMSALEGTHVHRALSSLPSFSLRSVPGGQNKVRVPGITTTWNFYTLLPDARSL